MPCSPCSTDRIKRVLPPQAPTLTMEGGRLKRAHLLTPGRDFETVPEPVWRALYHWYGANLSLPRPVCTPSTGPAPGLGALCLSLFLAHFLALSLTLSFSLSLSRSLFLAVSLALFLAVSRALFLAVSRSLFLTVSLSLSLSSQVLYGHDKQYVLSKHGKEHVKQRI